MKENFEEALVSFVSECQKIIDKDGRKMTLGLLVAERNRRWIRISENRKRAWAFIDTKNGDIYYPAGWSKPAKHARGNIFSDNPMDGITVFGPKRLPTWRDKYENIGLEPITLVRVK